MPKLIANAAYTYAGRALQPGDEFEASEKDARLLKLVKRAGDAKPASLEDRQLSLAGDKAEDQHDASQSRRGRYSRRDMRAES